MTSSSDQRTRPRGLHRPPSLGILPRFPMNRLRQCIVFVVLSSGILLAGCKGNCRKLSEKLCDCSANNTAKDQCLQRAAQEDGRVGPTPADDALCGQLLQVCDCHIIDTVQGKVNCGLARK